MKKNNLIFYIIALFISVLAISCEKKEDSIKVDDINGICESATFTVTKEGKEVESGTAKVTAGVENDKTLILYAGSVKGYEVFIKTNDFNREKTATELILSSVKESPIELKIYKKAKEISGAKISEFKLSYNGATKRMALFFVLDGSSYSYSCEWNNSPNYVPFNEIQYVPAPIEKLVGRSSKVDYFKMERLNYKRETVYKDYLMTGELVSFYVLDNDDLLFVYSHRKSGHDMYLENFYKYTEYNVEEKGDELILTAPRLMNPIVCAEFLNGKRIGLEELSTNRCLGNFKFVYNKKTKRFLLAFGSFTAENGKIEDPDDLDRWHKQTYVLKGDWDTGLEPYSTLESAFGKWAK